MRNYHLVTTSTGERDITASEIEVLPSGALAFLREDGKSKVTYAPGSWAYVETEMQDDRGAAAGTAARGKEAHR